ncbi:hypothetical protein LEMLEM_LOCUS22755, partial [Lemmus lemmus]
MSSSHSPERNVLNSIAFAQPDHRNINLQGQVNRGNQIVSIR